MSIPAIAYRIHGDDVHVVLRQTHGAAVAVVPQSDLKRFAWGLLNDLDPHGVYAHDVAFIGRGSAAVGHTAVRPRKAPVPRVLERRFPPRPFDKAADDLLRKLVRDEGLTYAQAAGRMERSRESVGGRVARLKKAGLW